MSKVLCCVLCNKPLVDFVCNDCSYMYVLKDGQLVELGVIGKEYKCKRCGGLLENFLCKPCGYLYELNKGRLWEIGQPGAPSMNMWSTCKFCNQILPDFEGNSAWDIPEEEKTEIVCDTCRLDQRHFVMINEFIEGKEYDFPYNHRHVHFVFREVLKKFGPKSKKSYPYLQLALGDCHPSDAVKAGKT